MRCRVLKLRVNLSLTRQVPGVETAQRPRDAPPFSLRVFSAHSVAVRREPVMGNVVELARLCRTGVAAALCGGGGGGSGGAGGGCMPRKTVRVLQGTDNQVS
jgi:hypothetical protein